MSNSKKIVWYNLAFMAFSTVWGFGNVVNGFVYFNGVQVIFSWIMMFALYFVPYALMVGELGSAFKNAGGGVSSWIQETLGPKLAYYAGWTYWVVHMPYIASKASGGLKALSWVLFQNSSFYDSLDIRLVQIITLVVFLVFAWVASRGLNPLKSLATIAGSSMFVMSILFIILMMAAPALNPNGGYQTIDWSFKNLIPSFRLEYFTSLSILVFAVGGCEKISPYVNKVENPSKGFPKGMIALAIMVIICAILGTISMGMMFNVAEINAKSTHNRRECPVYGHRGGSRGRFYYRITTFEGRPWDARDPHKTTFMTLKHAIRLSIWRKQKETPGVEKAPGVSSPQRKESGRSGRDDGELRFGYDPAIHARRLRVYHRPRRLRMALRISIILYSRRFSPANLMG